MELANLPFNGLQTVSERIRQRRAQLLVHSCLYYEFDAPVINDAKWDQWAAELVQLQAMFGSVINYYDDVFEGWDGATGYHLPVRDPKVMQRALRLQKTRQKGD